MGFAESFLSLMDTLWTVFIWTWWLLLIIGLFITKKRYERWPIEAVIIEKRGNNLIKTNDRIGRISEADTGLNYYKLMKIKDTIPIFDFKWILHNADKPMSIFEKIVMFLRPNTGTVFLYRYGSKQYKPINIEESGQKKKLQLVELKDKEGMPIYKYDYVPFDPRETLLPVNLEIVDWDNMNFMVQEQRATAIRRAKKGDFWKGLAIPALMIGGAALVALLILKFSADAGSELRAGVGAATDTGNDGSVIGNAIGGIVQPKDPNQAPGG